MVAPSFVTSIEPVFVGPPMLMRILSIPFGPRVLLTKSPMFLLPQRNWHHIFPQRSLERDVWNQPQHTHSNRVRKTGSLLGDDQLYNVIVTA